MKDKKSKIEVQGIAINIVNILKEDYISLTDIARQRDSERSDYILQNWLRNRSTIEFIGLWEQLKNPSFNSIEFDGIKNLSGLNSFSLTPKRWIESTNSIGIISKSGRYGGTFAHKDIAFEFATWISPEFKLYLITEFQRLKEDESSKFSLEWNLNRTLSKLNYKIQTDAIKAHIIPSTITKEQANFVYASEADILNVALFGKLAKQWRDENPKLEGNMRDYATIQQLLVLANMESINAEFIKMNLPQNERIVKLNQTAIVQLKSITNSDHIQKLIE